MVQRNQPPPLRESTSLRQAVILWAILSVLLIIIVVVVPPQLYGIPPQAADRARDYALTMEVFTILACPVIALVMAFAFYALFRWRSPGRPRHDAPYHVAGKGIQVAWVAISSLLVTMLYAWGLIFLNRADAAPPPGTNVLHVDVMGEQWHWNFTYPQYGDAQSGTLEVPLNRPILFQITSADVVHSFGVTAWALKEDAVPGQFTWIRVTPDLAGTFDFRCYELCGMFHPYMEGRVSVVAAKDFAAWVHKQPRGYPWPIGGAGTPNTYIGPHKSGAVPTKVCLTVCKRH